MPALGELDLRAGRVAWPRPADRAEKIGYPLRSALTSKQYVLSYTLHSNQRRPDTLKVVNCRSVMLGSPPSPRAHCR